MTKKKEIEKEVETKLTFNDIKEKCLKYIKTNKDNIIKGIVSFAVLVLVVIVGIAAIDAIKENSLDNIDYPLVYRKESGEIILLESNDQSGKEGYVLSTSDGTGYTTYGNTSNRYVLTKKENDLYIYDTKKEGKVSKISDDVTVYGFSKKDSYIYLIDSDNDLYSYDYKSAKKMLDAGITSIQDYSDKSIIYEKKDKLYYLSFDPSKEDKKEIVKGYVIAEFSEDGQYILYTNSNNALYRYNIKKNKHTKIGSHVDRFYCDDKSCEKIFYTSSSEEYSLNYYNGKKTIVLEDKIYDIEDIDVENKRIVYSIAVGDKIEIYFKKGKSKSSKINDDFTLGSSLKMLDDGVYYINDKSELIYAKINDKKIGKTKIVDKEVESSVMEVKGGVYYYKNINKNNDATFYVAYNGKKTKISDDIRDTKISVSNDGEKIYYIKEIENDLGTLCVFENKKSKKISGDVYRFLYIRDNMVYYLKNYNIEKRIGGLYRYDGENEKIEDKVTDLSITPNKYSQK